MENKRKSVERLEFDFKLKTEDKSIATTPLLKYISERHNDRKMLENKHNPLKGKITENCIIFVNSSMKRNQKFNPRGRKAKFINYNF